MTSATVTELQAHLTAASNAFAAALPLVLKILVGLTVVLAVVVVGLLRLSPPQSQSDPTASQRRGGQSLPGTGGTAPGARDGTGHVGHGTGGRMVSAASLLRKQSKKTSCLLGPHFARGAVALLHGPSGEGKSRWLAEVVWAVVRGVPLFGWPTIRGSVLWVTEETMSVWKGKAAMVLPDREATWPWWLLAMRDRCPRVFPPTVWVLSLPDLGIEPTAETYREVIVTQVEEECRRVGKVVMVIQDTVLAVCPQAVSANETAKVFMRYNAGLAFRLNVANVLVHHDNDDGKPLGAKMLKGAADHTLHVHRVEGESEGSRLRAVDFGKRYEPYPPPPLLVTMRDDGRQERVGAVPVWPPLLEGGPASVAVQGVDDDGPERIIDDDAEDEDEERAYTAPPGGSVGHEPNGQPDPRTLAPRGCLPQSSGDQPPPSARPKSVAPPSPAGTCTNPATCLQLRSYLLTLPAGGGVTFRELRDGTGIANGTLGRHLKHLLANGSVMATGTGEVGSGGRQFWLAGRQPEEPAARASKPNKYNATPQEYNGARYDSKGEAAYAQHLDTLKATGQIADWRRGRKWVLQDADPESGVREIGYIPDFERLDAAGNVIEVIDFKGMLTDIFKAKAKMFKARYPGTPLRIVTKADLPATPAP